MSHPLQAGQLPARITPARRVATREMVHARTRHLASVAGRPESQVSHLDYEQARRDVTGETDRERQEAMLDAGPPAARPR